MERNQRKFKVYFNHYEAQSSSFRQKSRTVTCDRVDVDNKEHASCVLECISVQEEPFSTETVAAFQNWNYFVEVTK